MSAIKKNVWQAKLKELADITVGVEPREGKFLFAILIEEYEDEIHTLTFGHGFIDPDVLVNMTISHVIETAKENMKIFRKPRFLKKFW